MIERGLRPARALGLLIGSLAVLAAFAPRAGAIPLVFNEDLDQVGSPAPWVQYTATDLAAAASDIQPGAILRFTVAWDGIQPTCFTATGGVAGSRSTCKTPEPIQDWNLNWNNLESDLNSLQSAGYLQGPDPKVRLLPIVDEAPGWAEGVGDSVAACAQQPYSMPPGGDPTALGWWQQFNAGFVNWLESTYGKASLAGVEVWNEEDLYGHSWDLNQPGAPCPGQTNTAGAYRYSQVLCSAYAGVRQSDAALPVIFGGTDQDPPFLTDAYKSPLADIKGCMTAIGIHPYSGGLNPPWDTSDPFYTEASDYEGIACAQGDCSSGPRPIWITEFGYPIYDPPNSSGPTEQEQADWDSCAYTVANAEASGTTAPCLGSTPTPNLPYLQTMGIHTMFDYPLATSTNGPFPFGICDGSGSPRPAANELKQAVTGDPAAVAAC
jgi:hypothetical protein